MTERQRLTRKAPIPVFRKASDPARARRALQLREEVEQNVPLPRAVAARRRATTPNPKPKVPKARRPSTERRRPASGGRLPEGFSKVGVLGRGGFGVVIEAVSGDDGARVALKQVSKRGPTARSALAAAHTEVAMAEMLMAPGSPTAEEAEDGAGAHPRELFARLHRVVDLPGDLWLVFSKGGQPLSKLLFELKGEFHNGERVYRNSLQPFYQRLRADRALLRGLIRRLVQAVALMATRGVVHADFKPDNLLVRPDLPPSDPGFLRVVDFGSAFAFDAPGAGGCAAATPEYLAPELAGGVEGAELRRALDTGGGHAVDMWALGCVVLEMAAGCPVWFPYKTRVRAAGGATVVTRGLFATSGRGADKIAEQQAKVVAQLPQRLARCCPLGLADDPLFIEMLQGMLAVRPEERWCPADVLEQLREWGS